MIYIDSVHKKSMDKKVPDFSSGDTVKVYQKIKEGDKERIQVFQGIVIARNNSGISRTFTVRKISFGTGVERIFPLYSPNIDKIEVVKKGKVARSKLYYLRNLTGKRSRIKDKKHAVQDDILLADGSISIAGSASEPSSPGILSALETSGKTSALLTSVVSNSSAPPTSALESSSVKHKKGESTSTKQ